MTLEFTYAECDEELRVIEGLAAPFLANPGQLTRFRLQLNQMRLNRTTGSWQLPLAEPLRTVECDGQYEPKGRRGGHRAVRGEMSAIWQIRPIAQKKTNLPPKRFAVTGKASTLLRLVQGEGEEAQEFVVWRAEFGDADSPGTFFHVQIGEERVGAPNHQPLPVPRLPITPITPMLALEYLIVEIFQTGWPEQLASHPNAAGQWRRLQLPRFERFIKWQEAILKNRVGSPVVALKQEKPPANLFDPKAALLA